MTPQKSGEILLELIMRRYENRSTRPRIDPLKNGANCSAMCLLPAALDPNHSAKRVRQNACRQAIRTGQLLIAAMYAPAPSSKATIAMIAKLLRVTDRAD
jgi:hypothetical protein